MFAEKIDSIEKRVKEAVENGDYQKFNDLSEEANDIKYAVHKSEFFLNYCHHMGIESYLSPGDPLSIANYDSDLSMQEEIDKHKHENSLQIESMYNAKYEDEKAQLDEETERFKTELIAKHTEETEALNSEIENRDLEINDLKTKNDEVSKEKEASIEE